MWKVFVFFLPCPRLAQCGTGWCRCGAPNGQARHVRSRREPFADEDGHWPGGSTVWNVAPAETSGWPDLADHEKTRSNYRARYCTAQEHAKTLLFFSRKIYLKFFSSKKFHFSHFFQKIFLKWKKNFFLIFKKKFFPLFCGRCSIGVLIFGLYCFSQRKFTPWWEKECPLPGIPPNPAIWWLNSISNSLHRIGPRRSNSRWEIFLINSSAKIQAIDL